MSILRLLLYPLSLIYGAYIIARNILFDIKILRSYKSTARVISVGNITTGGTGKTPFVIFLAEMLLNLDKSVCVISRGYKRKSEGLIVGFDGNKIRGDISSVGDELSMIIERFSRFTNRFYALADSNRVRAVKYAESKFKPDVILLDDAYQHRYIKRDLDIVIVAADQNSLLYKTLIPSGNLREPFACLCRSGLIVRNFKFSECKDGYPLNTVPEIRVCYDYDGIFDALGNPPEAEVKNVVAISGIADNKSFFNALKKIGYDVIRAFEFGDHHSYSHQDIDSILNQSADDDVFVTTEKDFIKLKKFANFTIRQRVYYLKLKIKCDSERLKDILVEKRIL